MSEKHQEKHVKKASALVYQLGQDTAPRVVATGRGESADRIVAIAKEANVPVYTDAHLADVLGAIKVGSEIPRELYEVVAEVLAFISRLDEQQLQRGRRG